MAVEMEMEINGAKDETLEGIKDLLKDFSFWDTFTAVKETEAMLLKFVKVNKEYTLEPIKEPGHIHFILKTDKTTAVIAPTRVREEKVQNEDFDYDR